MEATTKTKIKYQQEQGTQGCALFALANLFNDESFISDKDRLNERHLVCNVHESLPVNHPFRNQCRVATVSRSAMPDVHLLYAEITRARILLFGDLSKNIRVPILIETAKGGYHVTPAVITPTNIIWQAPLADCFTVLESRHIEKYKVVGIHAIFSKDGKSMMTYER